MDDLTSNGSRPIGWWLKEADAALDAAFGAALAGDEVERRGWQILALMAGGPMHPRDIKEALASFDPPQVLATELHHLRSRGWVGEEAGLLHLTDAGAAKQAELARRVGEVRALVAAALPPEDHQRLVALLARLVAGLRQEGAAPQPSGRPIVSAPSSPAS
jgi:hypothetical protein